MLTNPSSSNSHSEPFTLADSRTGSALLIVVGTLALIAVFAAIYISIGQSDRRVANSVKNNVQVEDFRDSIANHITGVIGMDRYDITVHHRDTGNDLFSSLEVTDAPYTDWSMKSESANQWNLFNPNGSSPLVVGPAADEDYRVASDPWLASTLPTFLGDPGFPTLSNDLRPFASLITDTFPITNPSDPSEPINNYIASYLSSGFLDNRDYLQISNLAPDGRFVNLYNLRANTAQSNGFNDTNIGGFDSEPGTGTFDRDSDNRTVRRMSNYLSLWKQEQPGEPDSRIKAFDPEVEGIWMPGRNSPVSPSDHGITDVTNTPAVYTMYQRFAFLPLNQPFITVNRNSQISTWADPDYAPYQWADTNGDGMADARWFELTSARELLSSSNTPRDDIEKLYDAGQFRLFAAARVVDLSSMVNVNTATDQLLMPEPIEGAPIGATPAEVDLRRLLSMSDAAENYAISNPLTPASLSPSQWHRPRGSRLNPMQNFPEQTRDDDYFYYLSYIDRDATPKIVKPHSTSLNVGRYAYNAIKRGIVESETLDERYFAWPPEVQAGFGETPVPATPADFDLIFNSPSPSSEDTSAFSNYRLKPYFFEPMAPDDETAMDRVEYFNEYGIIDPTTSQLSTGLVTSALYNNDDLFELLAFHGLNDPSRVSRLEKNAMGRMPSLFQQNQRAFSPLFSNRALEFDRYQHGYVEENGYTVAGGYPIDTDPTVVPRRIEGSIAKESMAFFATSPRRLLTTVSGAAHLKPGAVINPSFPTINGSEATDLRTALGDVQTLFSMYSSALAGELDLQKLAISMDDLFVVDPSTTRTDSIAGPYATAFYGHRGPELALRIAAHSAVNMKDLNDSDQTPTAATIILDDTRRDDFLESENYDLEDRDQNEYSQYAGRATNNLLDTTGMTPDGVLTADQPHRLAVDVYGVEPMPFLTEMSSLYVYVDSSTEQGGADGTSADDASPNAPRNLGPFVQFPSPLVEVTINGNVTEANDDLKIQVLAFQLTNPWNEDIIIGGGSGPMGYIDEDNNPATNTNLQFDYYIEFGGRFFKLGQFVEFNPDERNYDTPTAGSTPPGENENITDAHEEYQYQGTSIPANSSRVFYAIANSRFRSEDGSSGPDSKWLNELGNPSRYTATPSTDPDGDGLADGSDDRDWTGPAREWVDSQFADADERIEPVHIHQFDPRTGHLVEYGEFHDLMQSPTADAVFDTAVRAHDHTQARLWRKITGTLEDSLDEMATVEEKENLIQNDLLVDRLKIPAGESLDRSLAGGNQAIEGSFGYDISVFPEGTERAVGARNDNYGLTMARWATVRRLDNADDARNYRSGMVGAWMLSSNTNPDTYTNFSHDPMDEGDDGDLDIADFLPDPLDLLSDPEFISEVAKGDLEVDRSFIKFWNKTAGASSKSLIQTIVQTPDDKYKPAAGELGLPFGVPADFYSTRFPIKAIASNVNGQVLHATDSDLIPELLPNAQGFNDAPRLADLLLAWGIGPTHTPDPTSTSTDFDFDDADEGLRWMTVAESLAIGLGFETINAYNASEPAADNIWYEAMGSNGNVLDNGHLAIDRFVSYYNVDTAEVNPEFDTLDDIRRGTGVPMALGILDQARPLPVPPPISGTDMAPAISTPTYGLININTAPAEVLRLLPGLSPSRTTHYPINTSPTTEDEWWANNGDNTNLDLPNLSSAVPSSPDPALNRNRTPDVAATLAGYRDRTQVDSRFASTNVFIPAPSNPFRYFTRPAQSRLQGQNMIGEQTADELTQTNDFRDRASISGVDGLRPTPGFGSMGEIFMATIGPDAVGAGSNPLRSVHSHLDIQQYGQDGLELDGGIDYKDGVAIDPQLFGGIENGGTADDYAERLAMANGILNTISVRSDYYAVWFVIHAYQESDVANLQPDDPLVPSLAKRYVMVVDRTNVVDAGDTPRIVFLKEVPM